MIALINFINKLLHTMNIALTFLWISCFNVKNIPYQLTFLYTRFSISSFPPKFPTSQSKAKQSNRGVLSSLSSTNRKDRDVPRLTAKQRKTILMTDGTAFHPKCQWQSTKRSEDWRRVRVHHHQNMASHLQSSIQQ